MPQQRIKQKHWEQIQSLTVELVIHLRVPVKDTDVLHYLISKSLTEITIEELTNQFLIKKSLTNNKTELD